MVGIHSLSQIFFISISAFNVSLYLSWAFGLNVGIFRTGSLLLMLMLGKMTAALFHLVGPAAFDSVLTAALVTSMAAYVSLCHCICIFCFFFFL